MRSKSRAKRSNTELNPLIGDFINTIGQVMKRSKSGKHEFDCKRGRGRCGCATGRRAERASLQSQT
jgi:hypothetical protein